MQASVLRVQPASLTHWEAMEMLRPREAGQGLGGRCPSSLRLLAQAAAGCPLPQLVPGGLPVPGRASRAVGIHLPVGMRASASPLSP